MYNRQQSLWKQVKNVYPTENAEIGCIVWVGGLPGENTLVVVKSVNRMLS